jgi:pimeloyl-ACP methyl ester carboxylesterase
MPVMLMAGGLDAKYADLAARMGREIPEGIVKIIPEVGHNIHLENPEQFSEVVTVFLQDSLKPNSNQSLL